MLFDSGDLKLDLEYRKIIFKSDLDDDRQISIFDNLFERFIKPIGSTLSHTELNSKTFPTKPIETYETNIIKSKLSDDDNTLLYYWVGAIVLDKAAEIVDKNVAKGKSIEERLASKEKAMKKRAKAFNDKFDESDVLTIKWRPVTNGFMNVTIIFDRFASKEVDKNKQHDEDDIVLRSLSDYRKEEKEREYRVAKEKVRIEALENRIVLSEGNVDILAQQLLDRVG